MKKLIPLLTICVFCLSPLSFAGKIYKWTDSEGNVHYGERPPSKQAQQVKVRKGPSNPAPATKTSSQYDSTKKLLDSIEKDRKDKKEAADKAAAEQERRAKNCANAKKRVAGLKLGGRQFVMTEDGERNYLNEADIQQRLSKAQEAVDKWCK